MTDKNRYKNIMVDKKDKNNVNNIKYIMKNKNYKISKVNNNKTFNKIYNN